jgi:site-specific recombinase XerD
VTRRQVSLPPFAQDYLRIQPTSRKVVCAFHRWLQASGRALLQLEQPQIETFLLRFASKAPSPSKRLQRRMSLRYFDWLHDQKLLRFDPRCAWPRSNFALPQPAVQFLESLAPTHKLSTVRGHQSTLRAFHIWLRASGAAPETIDRPLMSRWLNWMHARGLSASARVHCIQQVRAYLRWLEDKGTLVDAADLLLRSSDFPKLPQYLPRPLPPPVDAQLQRRLLRSESIYKLGLLLMRRTGLRVGELINLSFSCIRVDPKGNRMLKVPLGKLDTERLVPLDKLALRVLNKLRRLGSRRRLFLLEETPGTKTSYALYRDAIQKAAAGLQTDEPITTHRLRHTYATTLLAGGMSLVGLMRLLGHKDYRMTLRYAAITDETVLIEYASALDRSVSRYDMPALPQLPADRDPARQLVDLARQLHLRIGDNQLDPPKTRRLVLRLRRLAVELRRLERAGKPRPE